jgi:hypothetical protein
MRKETIVEGLMLKTRVEEGKEGSRVSESGSQRSRSVGVKREREKASGKHSMFKAKPNEE